MRWLARGESALPAHSRWLTPAEARRSAELDHPKRRAGYLTRRLAAKQAAAIAAGLPGDEASLARLEVRDSADGSPFVLLDGDRMELDVSLSDRAGWAVCVTSDGRLGGRPSQPSVGCDLELIGPLSPMFLQNVLSEDELRFVARQPGEVAQYAAANLLWSAKESALILLRGGRYSDTRRVEVVPLSGAGGDGWFPLVVLGAGGREFPGWWRRDGVFLLTVVCVDQQAPPVALDDEPVLATAMPGALWGPGPGAGPESGEEMIS